MCNINFLLYFLSQSKIIHTAHCSSDLSHLSWISVWCRRCHTGHWTTWHGAERDPFCEHKWCSVNADGNWELSTGRATDRGLDLTPAFFTLKTLTKAVCFFYPRPFLFLQDIFSVFLPMKMKKLSEEAVGILVPRGVCAFASLLCCWRLLLEVELADEKLTGIPVPYATHSCAEVKIRMI